MFFGLFWGDWTLLLLVPAMIFALVAQIKVQSSFAKYNKVQNSSGLSGADAARAILDRNGLSHVRVERVSGHLTDHYDPRTNVIRLSESTYDSRSVAAVGEAAHVAGHAVQHATGYLPIKIRSAIIPVTQIGSALSMPLFLIGLILAGVTYSYSYFSFLGELLMFLGIIFFATSTLFQLVTLPTEFNASGRALKILEESGMMYGSDLEGAKKVLSAAAMTYVAALATSLANLFRFILIAAGASKRR